MRAARKPKSPDGLAWQGVERAITVCAAPTYRAVWRWPLAALILAGLLTLGGKGQAHGVKCAGLMAWLDMLEKPPYGEKLIDGGIGGLPIVHLENEATGTWTLLRVDASGWACMIAEGRKVVTASDPPA